MAYAHMIYNKICLRIISSMFLLINITETSETQMERTTVGGDAVLPCKVDPTDDDLDVKWTRTGLPPEQYVYYQRNGHEFDDNKYPSYKGRTSLFMEEVKKGNVSLKLSRVESSDAGTYTCYIPELKKKVHIVLLVDEPGVPDRPTGSTEDEPGVPDRPTGSTEVERDPDSHGGSRQEGEFPWWGGVLITVGIISIIIIVSVPVVMKRKKGFYIEAKPTDTKDRDPV